MRRVVMVVNLNAKDFRKQRKVKETIHFLSRPKKKKLLQAPLAQVLDMGFLRHAGLERSETALRTACDGISLALAALNINSLQQLQELSVQDLARLPRLGNKTLAVLLDLLQAFDVELSSKPKYKKLEPFNGTALARSLGLTT